MKLVALFIVVLITILLAGRLFRISRQHFIERYRMPDAVLGRFRAKRPELTDDQATLVLNGLRQYFQICVRARGKFVSMPSQAVDDLWHEFILFTRNYRHFCSKAFWRYLHHTPVEAMPSRNVATAGIRRAWFHACRIEGINPKQPDRLPLLFALDAQLGIANGFVYRLNCSAPASSSSNTFCASDIGCGTGSSCGGGSCGGDTGGHGGDGGGDGGCGGGD